MDEQPLNKTAKLRRRIQRELAWLRAMNIERDHDFPLYPNQQKTGGKFLP